METFNLNLIPGKNNPVVHASQFDEGRVIRVNLFEGSSVYNLDGTEVISISVRKNDGHIVTEAITNTSDSYVEIVTTEQMTACSGSNLCELKIEKGSDVIGTLNFILEVEVDPLDGGDPSESFIYDLNAQIYAAVADQYDSNNVIFDAAPTPGHGVGYVVTSEGTPDELEDMTDVTYTGSPSSGEALVWDGSKWTNGTPDMDVSDLADVTITTPSDDDILVYQNGKWVNMANPASTANFADAYDPTATYNTGDVCIYNNVLYICTDDNITGTFDPSKWTATTIDNIIGSLSTLTTTDKSSIVGAVNEVNGKATTQSATFTPESGVSVMHISSGYTSKQGCISAEIRFTGSANAWKTLGTLSIKPNDSCQVIGINTGTGAPVGIVRLRNDTGAVEVYPTSSISNAAVGFSIAFVIA